MKWLLILLILLNGCTIKEDPQEEIIEEEPEVVEEIVPGDFNDFVVLREGIVFPEHDVYYQDYYSNSLAFYKDNQLSGFLDPHGDDIYPEGSICSVHLINFNFNAIDPLNPAQLTMTCDGSRKLYGYGEGMKSLYFVGDAEPDYPWGLNNNLRMLYVTENSTIIKEIDMHSYLNRGPNDPLIIKNYEPVRDGGVVPVYELKQEPKLIDGEIEFDLTGTVGFATGTSYRPDILGTLKFDGVGADTSSNGELITVIIDGKLGLADMSGNMVIEPIYDPVQPLSTQIYSHNYQVLQKGPAIYQLPLKSFIRDYQSNTHFVSESGQTSNFRPVRKDGKVGFLDEKGQELDTFYFDDVLIASHNRAWVKQNETWSIIEIGKDIGYQQQDLVNAFNNEPFVNQELSQKFLSGDVCLDNYELYRVTAEIGLFVRDANNMESGNLGVLNFNQRVCGIDQGDWIEFDYQGQPGYLYKEYMERVEDTNEQ